MTTSTVQHLNIDGSRFVLIREAQYERLCREAGRMADVADDELPALPEADENGNVPAIEYSRVSIARDLVRRRLAAGLSQTRLAELAGVRQETVSRIESGKHTLTPVTYDKIFNAIETAPPAEKPTRPRGGKPRNGTRHARKAV